MRKRITGILKNPSEDSNKTLASHNPWNTGKAAYYKRLQKMLGEDRPST